MSAFFEAKDLFDSVFSHKAELTFDPLSFIPVAYNRDGERIKMYQGNPNETPDDIINRIHRSQECGRNLFFEEWEQIEVDPLFEASELYGLAFPGSSLVANVPDGIIVIDRSNSNREYMMPSSETMEDVIDRIRRSKLRGRNLFFEEWKPYVYVREEGEYQ